MERRAVGLALAVALAIVGVLALARALDDAPVAVPRVLPVGTFMYLQLEGPVLLEWDTRTGNARLCMVQDGEVRCR